MLALTLAVAASGCGTDKRAGGGSAPSSAQLSAARARLDRFRRVPPFVPPGPRFDTRSRVHGKRIFEIPITSEVPFIAAVEGGMRQAVGRVGAQLVTYPNQGRPEQWAQGIRTAIAEHAGAIVLLAQDPRLVAPQITAAKDAGIPVVVVRTTGDNESCQTDAAGHVYGTACVPGPFEEAGRLEADWVITAKRGKADVLIVTSNDARSTIPLSRGLMDEFRARCPGCDLRFVDVPIPQWATQLRGEISSALVRDPGIDYVIPLYDSMSQFIVPAIRERGAANRVKISTFNGTPFVLKMLEEGDVVRMDAGEDLAWVGWAAMDQTFRVIAGLSPVPSEHTPLRVFDKGNVHEAGTPPGVDRGYGGAFVPGYARLWGLTGR